MPPSNFSLTNDFAPTVSRASGAAELQKGGACDGARPEGRAPSAGRQVRFRTRFTMKRCAAGPRWAARFVVLGRPDSAAIGAPCVLASHHPAHPVGEPSF